ncbi:MAG: hypothetical protein H0U44_07655 [Flavisolibacter sp.]|nr:hypothetical protein [Flavisolibacter sp.]
MNLKKKLFLLCLFAFSYTGFSQKKSIDTVEYARSLAMQKRYEDAHELLKVYNMANHNVYALWLHAQVNYWMQNFSEAEEIYEKAIKDFPGVHGLALSYGEMLWEIGKFKESKPVLEHYIAKEPGNARANMLLAYMHFWNTEPGAAKEKLVAVLKKEPTHAEALQLKSAIEFTHAPNISLEGSLLSDDQELNRKQLLVTAGWLASKRFAPALKFTFADNQYGKDTKVKNQTYSLLAGNTFRFNFAKTLLNVEAGFFNSGQENFLIGALKFTQKFSPNLNAHLHVSMQPYQYTLASINNPFTYTTAGVGLGYNKNDKWTGEAGYLLQSFEDGNKINNLFGWFLFPIISNQTFRLQGGYAYSYANAEINKFIPAKSLNEIASSQPPLTQVEGVYDPYFTPMDQHVHSLLLLIRSSLSKTINLQFKAGAAVLGKALNPYLMLDKNGSQFSITKTFHPHNYTPFELQAGLNAALNRKIMLHGNYNFNSLLFYNSHLVNLGLAYRFIK